jgi:hypothetical protein
MGLEDFLVVGQGTRKRPDYDPCRKTHQNTARIARITVNVAICRTFWRSILRSQYRPLMDRYRPLPQVPIAYRPPGNEPFCGTFILYAVPAVGAVYTFPSFT